MTATTACPSLHAAASDARQKRDSLLRSAIEFF